MPTGAMKTQRSPEKIVAYKIKDHNKPELGLETISDRGYCWGMAEKSLNIFTDTF